jgi:hypothetical protein
MKRLTALLAGLLFATAAYATCTSHLITRPDGSTIFCTTCCYGNNCNTICN